MTAEMTNLGLDINRTSTETQLLLLDIFSIYIYFFFPSFGNFQ